MLLDKPMISLNLKKIGI